MKTANIRNFVPAGVKNAGDAREWAYCAYAGVERKKHDAGAYDRDSDVNVGDRHISIKASKFSLMSGSLCEGLTDFDSIWNLYASKVHSNTFVYIDVDYTAYEMTLVEFKAFVYAFCKTERESMKNGGATKIRCKAESKKMIEWLQARA